MQFHLQRVKKLKNIQVGKVGGVSRTFKAPYGFEGRDHLKTTLASLGDH